MPSDALTAAATVLAALIGLTPLYLKRRRRGRQQPKHDLSQPSPLVSVANVAGRARDYPAWLLEGLPTGDRVYLRESTLGELLATIAPVHPLQAESVGEDLYKGRWVRWKGTIKQFQPDDYATIVSLAADGGGIFNVTFPPSAVEELTTFRINDFVLVDAQVRTVKHGFAELIRPTMQVMK